MNIFTLILLAAEIRVEGAVLRPQSLSEADLQKLPRASLMVKENNGEVRYEGVLLYEVLKLSGAPLDSELKGSAIASYVIAQASDGYQVIFALPEIDPAFTDKQILLADRVDGKPLPARAGPFRLIVPQDKRAARAIRMLERLEVVRVWK